MRLFVAALLTAAAPIAVQAEPTPKEQLLVPPATADHFIVVSDAGKHGEEWRWTLPNGREAYRQSILLRGLVFEQDEVVQYDRDGFPMGFLIRGVTPTGDAAESFTVEFKRASSKPGVARWKSPVDAGEAPYDDTLYVPYGGTFLANEQLLAGFSEMVGSVNSKVRVLPSGELTLQPSRTLTLMGAKGPKTIQLHFLKGLNQAPTPLWLDSDRRLFAISNGLGVLPAGYEQNFRIITAEQEKAIAAMAPATARKFLTVEARKPILFRNVKIFDAERERFVEGQNVVVSGGRIVSVGTALPKLAAGARVIEGTGKTLVPGLWDSHMHLSDDFNAVSELAIGVTSCRNPGGSIDLAVSQRNRRANGQLLAPECFSSAIIDKKGPLAAQGSLTVGSLAETLAAVRKIKAAGMTGVKFYTSMEPAWIAPAAKLAHQLGLHVHGHIPAGMRTIDAINAGYDEITHIYFSTMQAMPDEVVAKANTTVRLTGPGRYFKDVDLNGPVIRNTIAAMKQHGTVIDPTLVVVENVLLAQAGTVSPAYVPYVGTLPPATERSFKGGGLPLPEGLSMADARASVKKMGEYVVQMRRAGVPIVAGTDGSGIELVRELELYVDAGMTPAEALATATLAAAKNVGADKRTGSITVGKEADLVLVNGDPEKNIGDLRHVEQVVLDGALLDASALRQEAGFSAAPK